MGRKQRSSEINITSNNQQGGITAHSVNGEGSAPSQANTSDKWNKTGVIAAIVFGLAGVVVGILQIWKK